MCKRGVEWREDSLALMGEGGGEAVSPRGFPVGRRFSYTQYKSSYIRNGRWRRRRRRRRRRRNRRRRRRRRRGRGGSLN